MVELCEVHVASNLVTANANPSAGFLGCTFNKLNQKDYSTHEDCIHSCQTLCSHTTPKIPMHGSIVYFAVFL